MLYPTELQAQDFNLPGRITPGVLPSALRAALRAFKIAPGNFVEPATLGLAYQLRLSTPHYIWVCGLDYLFTVSGAARIVSTEPRDSQKQN